MVNMGKRFADEDSDDDRNSSSDEDNGNWKRRRKTSETEDFVTKSLQALAEPEQKKPLKVVDTQVQKQLIQKQRDLNQKLSTLTKYDDLFESSAEDCLQNNADDNSFGTHEEMSVDTTSRSSSSKAKSLTTTIEVTTDSADVLAGGDTDEVSKISDPRLRRLERFKAEPPPPKIDTGPGLVFKVTELLNGRKPHDAYNLLKAGISHLELHKHTDLLTVMATDWFPSQLDNAYDPRSVYIEIPNLNAFSSLIKDIFSVKVRKKEFWETVINSTEKFINESKIKEISGLLTKLRWTLVKDIRDYLVAEDVKISLKVSNILLDHKIQLESNRSRHRRNFEATVAAHMPRMAPHRPPEPVIYAPPAAVSTAPPPVPVIIGRPDPRSMPRPKDEFDDQVIGPFQSTSTALPSNSNTPERRQISQIFDCLFTDQYNKLILMLERHTLNQTYAFIDYLGQALRQFVDKFPNRSVFTIYQKLHDTILLNPILKPMGTDDKRLDTIFEKLLKEFHETVIYNPKEWILIRDQTRTENFSQHFHPKVNPFNEPIIPILHNIIIDCGYISNGLVVNYSAIEEEIPLMAQNIILKDPRIELKSDPLVNSLEVVSFDDTVVGKFSPVRSDTSPSTSPEYSGSQSPGAPYSDSNSDVNSDANSDIVIVCEDRPNLSSPEPLSAVEEPPQVANSETALQKTENANPVRKLKPTLPPKPKIVKTGQKKVIPLTNKSNNKTNSAKTVVKKKLIHTKAKHKTINGQNSGSKPTKVIKTSATKAAVSAAAVSKESPVKPQPKTPISATISPKPPLKTPISAAISPKPQLKSPIKATISPNSTAVVNSVCNTIVSTVADTAAAPPKRNIIKIPTANSRYNVAELKRIVRRVSISSDESDG